MIRINLLPYRAAKKTQNVRRQITVFLITVILTLVAVFLYNRHLSAQIQEVETQIADVNTELSRMRKQIAEIDQLRARIKMIRQRIGVIDQLEVNRLEAAFLLNLLADLVIEEKGKKPLPAAMKTDGLDAAGGLPTGPDKRLWMTRLAIQDGRVDVSGIALDNQTVADYMTRLQKATRPLVKTDRKLNETDADWEKRRQSETKKVFASVVLKTARQQAVREKLKLKAFDITCMPAGSEQPKKQ